MKYTLSWKLQIKQQAAFWFVSIIFILAGILFLYIPEIISIINAESYTQKTTGNENDQFFYIFKIIGLMFSILGGFILLLTLSSLLIKIISPQNADFGNWWVNFIGGMFGALAFSMPSAFIWVIYLYLPEDIQSAFSEKSFLIWIFTGIGILVNIIIFFIAKSQIKGRPLWKK
jgi:hypothetical protein